MLRCPFAVVLGLAALAGLTGCNSSGGPGQSGTVDVTATVTYNGSPVSGAAVTLRPISRDGKGAIGITGPGGKATFMTFEPEDGALPGSYRVTISKMQTASSGQAAASEGGAASQAGSTGESAPPPTDLLPPKYKDPQTSGLTAEISAEGPNRLTFTLTEEEGAPTGEAGEEGEGEAPDQ